MKREDIRVTIDSPEKQQKAIEILNKYKQPIWDRSVAMDFSPQMTQLVFSAGDWFICYDVDINDEIEITLEQLEEILKQLNE
jgi:hypothetical protein